MSTKRKSVGSKYEEAKLKTSKKDGSGGRKNEMETRGKELKKKKKYVRTEEG